MEQPGAVNTKLIVIKFFLLLKTFYIFEFFIPHELTHKTKNSKKFFISWSDLVQLIKNSKQYFIVTKFLILLRNFLIF